MKAMQTGDEYNVISDVVSWRDGQLEKFRFQTEEAVKRGVRVRRVFNLARSSSRAGLRKPEVIKVLKAHLDDSRQWKSDSQGKYEVRIMDRIDLSQNPFPSSLEPRKITEAHFGIFKNEKQKIAVRFKVPTLDLSEMFLCRDQKIILKDLALFDAIWNVAKPLISEEQINQLKKS